VNLVIDFLLWFHRYLMKACEGLPPLGSLQRERLRGNNKSLKDYIALLSKNEEGNEEKET
jgi:hypothetical protein